MNTIISSFLGKRWKGRDHSAQGGGFIIIIVCLLIPSPWHHHLVEAAFASSTNRTEEAPPQSPKAKIHADVSSFISVSSERIGKSTSSHLYAKSSSLASSLAVATEFTRPGRRRQRKGRAHLGIIVRSEKREKSSDIETLESSDSMSSGLNPVPITSLRPGNDTEHVNNIIRLCPSCGQNRNSDSETSAENLSTENLTRLRIEAIKQQILDKLRMSNPPSVNASEVHVPAPLFDGGITDMDMGRHGYSKGRNSQKFDGMNEDADGYYGKTKRLIVQAEDGDTTCRGSSKDDVCHHFHFSSATIPNEIHASQLWVYWNGSAFSDHSVLANFSMEIKQKPTKRNVHAKTIATKLMDNPRMVGWLTFDVKRNIRRWHKHRVVEHTLRITCNKCKGYRKLFRKALESSLSDSSYKPFVVIQLAEIENKKRYRRSDCNLVGSQSCCRERLYVSFMEMGWDWIKVPSGFHANYCRGSCNSPLSDAQSTNLGLLALFKHKRREASKFGLTLQSCCVPTSTSPLSLYYLDNNENLILSEISGMKVNSCGCSY